MRVRNRLEKFVIATPLAIFVGGALAAGESQHPHAGQAEKAMAAKMMQEDEAMKDIRHPELAEEHIHEKWMVPPTEYVAKRSFRWADPMAMARGSTIYSEHCQVCHGADGKGTGPAAGLLRHKPANLINNFHHAPGDGDGYLLWRVSDGGTVEPFKSQNSDMPPFKHVLSEDSRWDVLAYIHAYFHLGLYDWLSAQRPPFQGGDQEGSQQQSE